jgi:hypothetical protein
MAMVVLAKLRIQTCSFKGKECAGPIPIMFSSNQEEAGELLTDPATAPEYCQAGHVNLRGGQGWKWLGI